MLLRRIPPVLTGKTSNLECNFFSPGNDKSLFLKMFDLVLQKQNVSIVQGYTAGKDYSSPGEDLFIPWEDLIVKKLYVQNM